MAARQIGQIGLVRMMAMAHSAQAATWPQSKKITENNDKGKISWHSSKEIIFRVRGCWRTCLLNFGFVVLKIPFVFCIVEIEILDIRLLDIYFLFIRPSYPRL